MNARDEVLQARLCENERMASAMLPNIFAGHLMFSSVSDQSRIITEFTDRVATSAGTPPHTPSAPEPKK